MPALAKHWVLRLAFAAARVTRGRLLGEWTPSPNTAAASAGESALRRLLALRILRTATAGSQQQRLSADSVKREPRANAEDNEQDVDDEDNEHEHEDQSETCALLARLSAVSET